MADLMAAIARTLKRLLAGGRVTDGPVWLAKLYAGLAPEFNRLSEYKGKVMAAAVPNENLPAEALDDLEAKYGIEHYLGLSEQERINRILERASGTGCGGPDWLQEQLQQAGFPLYVIANGKQSTAAVQYGDFQYSRAVQYGQSVSRTNPASVPGELIVSSPPIKGGWPYLTQYGAARQYSPVMQQYSKVTDPAYTVPQPARFLIPYEAKYWVRFFFLSPFADRLAASEEELLSLTAEQFRYLKRLVIQIKYLRDWCIAQVKIT